MARDRERDESAVQKTTKLGRKSRIAGHHPKSPFARCQTLLDKRAPSFHKYPSGCLGIGNKAHRRKAEELDSCRDNGG